MCPLYMFLHALVHALIHAPVCTSVMPSYVSLYMPHLCPRKGPFTYFCMYPSIYAPCLQCSSLLQSDWLLSTPQPITLSEYTVTGHFEFLFSRGPGIRIN